MSQKQQDLGIKIVDHRTDGEPEETFERFSDHKKFLKRMREITDVPPGDVVTEVTRSEIHLRTRPQQQSLMDDE